MLPLCTIDGAAFAEYVLQVLAPSPRAGDIVVSVATSEPRLKAGQADAAARRDA